MKSEDLQWQIKIILIFIGIYKFSSIAGSEITFHNSSHQITKRNVGSKGPTESTCQLPQVSVDKSFKVEYCPTDEESCSSKTGSKVPTGTLIIFSCNPGYQHIDGNEFVTNCVKGRWRPTISPCYSGQWSRHIFKCIPDCGKTRGNTQGLISHGKPENMGDSPWHVAIYDISNKNKELICGGTIVTSLIIISAAHCFFDLQEQRFNDLKNYEIIVAKYTIDYAKNDTTETKIFKIKKIFVPNELVKFTGDSTGYAGDIAILWLDEELTFSRGVLPACVDWTDTSRYVATDGTKGKLVGWGENEKKEPSSILRAAFIPYITLANCRGVVSQDFANSLATDKFCAGELKGAGARPGDSGGGLLVRNINSNEGLFYLRGIVSNKDSTTGENETSVAAFTDVAQYMKWIYNKRLEIEDEAKRLNMSNRSQGLGGSDVKLSVNYQLTRNDSNTAVVEKDETNGKFNNKTTVLTKGDPYQVVLEKCQEYINDVYESKKNLQDCVSALPLIPDKVPALLKEFPHMALIGYGSVKAWLCGGTLISETFVLTAAHCSKAGHSLDARWVRLGELSLEDIPDGAQPKDFEIVQKIPHPDYKENSYYHNIMLLKLNESVKFTSHMRPTCLWPFPSTSSLINQYALITGWGQRKAGEFSDILQKAKIQFVEDEECIKLYSKGESLVNGYSPSNMICAGDKINYSDACQGDGGGPIQVPVSNRPCLYYEVGIISFGQSICGQKGKPSVYTKISYYIPWIQKIVWP